MGKRSKAQVTLTSSESKKLLAKAIASTPHVKNALKNGVIAIHPSSSTFFLIEELGGKKPKGIWVCGYVLPKGTCVNPESQIVLNKLEDVGRFPFSWVFEKGVFKTGIQLTSILDKMGPEDVYIKGVNAIDPTGKVGSFYVRAGAGTIGRVIAASKRKGFKILIPVGLEKLIPTSVRNVAKIASREKTEAAIGIPVGLIPVPGEVVTEIEAIRILSGARATVVGAGGLGGAEGSLTLVIDGLEKQVNQTFQMIKGLKGVSLPKVSPMDCKRCSHPLCHLSGLRTVETNKSLGGHPQKTFKDYLNRP